MAISRLHFASIHFRQNHYNEVLLKLFKHSNFHPELASKFTDSVAGLSVFNKENMYEEICLKLEDASTKYGFTLANVEIENRQLNILKEKEYLDELLLEVEKVDAVKRQLDKILEENEEAVIQLQHVADINVNFDDLFTCKYLQVRFGKLPLAHVRKLDYYEALPFVFRAFHDDLQYRWCMYITTPANAPEIDNIFSSLFFERIHIPEFVHGEPELAIAEIQEEANVAMSQSAVLEKRISSMFENEKEKLDYLYTVAKHLNDVFIMQKYIVVIGEKLTIYGFVPMKDSKAFKASFEEIEDVHVDITPANSDARLTPPTRLVSNWFARPFRIFVEMYGVPGYRDVDPTTFVAISYTLLFGIMFGDVGQGLLLSLVGLFAYKKMHMELGAVGIRLGFSSAIFGVVFGSVFGNEHILTPFFNAMDSNNTMTLLLVAVALGVVLILIAMLFNMALNFRKKDFGEAIFSQNGVCGFVFYVSILAMVVLMMLGIDVVNTLYVLVLIVLPIIGVFLKEPLTRKLEHESMFPNGFGSFFMEGFFELFEVVLSFVTNTMSFLRVGGFVLSHAGMMLVVYTLATMCGGIWYWVILVIGNIFVMGLEGLIVGIQVLRLEFYEMFSRYYEGNGIPFQSIKGE